ncbi:helix-turn-helix domain-containing protein [Pseudomonas putida]
MSKSLLPSVLSRLKLVTGSESDADLSRALRISPQTLSSWKVRGSVPYSLCIDTARQYACSLDWLLLGERNPGLTTQTQEEWELEMLERVRSLSLSDRQAILLSIKDKQRIQQLERQLSELAHLLPAAVAD